MVANITIRPTKLWNLISLPNWATEILLSLAQEQNLVASFTQSSEQWEKAPLKNTTQSTVRTRTCLVDYMCT